MKKYTILIISIFAIANIFAQDTYDWKDNAIDANWKQGAAGARWYNNTNHNDYDDEPLATNILRFNNNHQLSMTNNVASGYSIHQIIFGSSNTSNRTISGNAVNFDDYSGFQPKIENSSTGEHSFDLNITVGSTDLQINPVSGNLNLGGTIDTNGHYLKIWGDNAHIATFNGVISNTGGFSIEQNSTVVFNASNTYTGVTNITTGTLEYAVADAISDSSNLNLNAGTFNSAGFSDTLGTLILADDSTINLGNGDHTITFSDSSGESWGAGKTLTINNWGTGVEGKIYVGNNTTGLTAGQLAQIQFAGYSNSGAYLMADGELVPANDSNSDVDDTGSQPVSALLNSIDESIPANAYNVLDFYISDYGDADGLPTQVTNIRIKPYLSGGSPNTADWTDNIGGVVLKNEAGPTTITTGTPTITDTYIDIPIAVGQLNIADGDLEEIGLYIYLNSSNLEDGKRLKFMIDADDHGFTADPSGSVFVDTFPNGDFNSNNFTIQVSSTELRYTQQPSNVEVNTVMSPDVIVSATDANGNIDIDFDGINGTIQLLVTGSTFDAGATDIVDAVAGIATFDNLIFTTSGAGVTLTTSNVEGKTEAISNPFIVNLVADDCSQLFISEYGHNSNDNNYIEIYNPTSTSVVLNTDYRLVQKRGGGTGSTSIIPLDGTIVAGDVFVISYTAGNVPGHDDDDNNMNYSGDDNMVLQWNGGSGTTFTTIDTIGDDLGDPGTGWEIAGSGFADTNNNTIIRKKSIQKPNAVWSDSAGIDEASSEWIVSSPTQANLQFHNSNCNFYPCSAIEETAILIDFDVHNTGYTMSPSGNLGSNYVYFKRTDGTDIGANTVFTNEDGFFFAAQDTDENPVNDSSPEFYINDVDISGLENLQFSILIAEDDTDPNQHWDSNTSMHITYDIGNTGVFKNLLWVESTHPTDVNYAPAVDIDFDGTGNTSYTITDTFELFSKNIPELGNEIDLKIVFSNLNNWYEDIAIDNIKVTGDRVPTTTWSAGAWTGGIAPVVSTRAVINDDYNTSTASIVTCNCEVKSGNTLTVDASHYLLVAGAIDNEGHIVVEHEGSLVQLDDHAANTGNGDYKIHKTTPQYADYDYTYWSSPVDNETIGSVLSGSHASYRFKLSTADFLDMFNGYGHPQTAGSSDSFDDNNDDWVNVASGEVMEKGKGYIAMGEGSDFPLDFTNIETDNIQAVVFDGGKVNNGVITVAVSLDKYNQDGTTGADSFHTNVNLIGNPYPSAIDIAALRTDDANAAILEGTFYVWTHDTQIASGGGPWAHNFTNDDYATITVDAAGVFSQVGAGNGNGTAASQFIASGQGFMANVTDNGEVTFNNAMRVTGDNDHFLKQDATENQVDRICLNFTQASSGLIRQALVGFYDTATDTYQAGQDGQRLENGQNTDFYSLISNDTRHFAIQNLATFNNSKTVSLGIEIAETGLFEIGLDYVTGVFEAQDVYLMDNRMGILHNLSQLGVYKFDILDIELGELNNRFEIKFVNGTTSTQDNLIDSLLIYPNPSNGLFNISYPTKEELTISIFDISGKLVKSINNIKDKQIDLSGYAKGIYFAKIDSKGIQTVKKIVLK